MEKMEYYYLQYHVLPKFRETGIRLQIALQI